MNLRIAPANIQLIGTELAISWNDGAESFFKLDELRRACPCAGCGGEPDVLGNILRPDVRYTPSSFELVRWTSVGGYSLQPVWGDGHNTGLYTFTYLRRLSGIETKT